jgi:ABC-type transport system involved in multi-copper enzyme maturation permease subunit
VARSLPIAGKDFRDIFRERTIVLALVVQLFIAAFSSFLLVGLVSLYDPGRGEHSLDSRVAYVGAGGFARHLGNSSSLRIVVTDQKHALDLFHEGQVDAVIEELYSDPAQPRTVNLLLPQGELRTTILVSVLKDQLKSYERELRDQRASQIQTQIVYIDADVKTSPFYSFAYALLVPLLLIVPVFLAGAVAADAVTQEVETRTLELLRASPAGASGIFLGKVLAPIAITPMQGLLWILLFDLNGIHIHNVVLVLTLMTALATIFVCSAVLFGLSLRKQGDAQVAYSLLVLLAFGATYLLPQPLLNTFARLSIGSLTVVEWTTVGAVAGAAGLLVLLGSWVAPRLIQRAT